MYSGVLVLPLNLLLEGFYNENGSYKSLKYIFSLPGTHDHTSCKTFFSVLLHRSGLDFAFFLPHT